MRTRAPLVKRQVVSGIKYRELLHELEHYLPAQATGHLAHLLSAHTTSHVSPAQLL